jgi:hypothetical protein
MLTQSNKKEVSSCFKILLLALVAFAWSFCVANTSAQEIKYKDYTAPKSPGYQGKTFEEKAVQKNVKRAYQRINSFARKYGKDAAEIATKRGKNRNLFGHQAPDRHPLDKYDGHLPAPVARIEYATDSVAMLSPHTFGSCLEPRLVTQRDGFPAPDVLNAHYGVACYTNCILLPLLVGRLDLANQDWKVFSYYWPQTQIAVNKAGAQVIDPTTFGESYGQRLSRIRTSLTEYGNEQAEEELQRYIKNLGLETSKFKDLPQRTPGREFFLQEDASDWMAETRYAGAMRTNVGWRAANARERLNDGWQPNDRCLFNALDPRTNEQKIVSYRYDQGVFALFARYPEIRKIVDLKRYEATTLPADNIQQAKNDKTFQQSLCASFRMKQIPSVYGGLDRVGFKAGGGKQSHMDYCLPNGGELSGSMVSTSDMPTLQADGVRATMAALVFGSKSFLDKLGARARSGTAKFGLDDKTLRINEFTLYQKRHSKTRARYAGASYQNMGPYKSEYPIWSLDKIMRVSPLQDIAGTDGQGPIAGSGANADSGGGASQAIQRLTRVVANSARGSACMRPEDMPNWSSEDSFSRKEFPLGLDVDITKNYGESRWAVWNRRVLCTCERWGFFAGCLNLNHGDYDQDNFAGVTQWPALPPPFQKAKPLLDGLAVKLN